MVMRATSGQGAIQPSEINDIPDEVIDHNWSATLSVYFTQDAWTQAQEAGTYMYYMGTYLP